MKETIKELAVTTESDIRGDSIGTQYGLQPVQFLKEVIDAAKKQLFFANFVRVIHAPKGVYEVVIPKRKYYQGSANTTFDTAGSDTSYGSGDGSGPYANTEADISWTTMDNFGNVSVTPAPVIAGYAIRNHDIRTNVVNLVEAAKEELSYAIGDRIDRLIATTIGDAQSSTDSDLGVQALYGGDATSDSTLEAGDVITTDLVAKAIRYLKDTTKHYRATEGTGGGYGAESTSSNKKNPWQNTADDPFVLFIGPAQEETFRKDSQFVNAAEYGSNIVVQNGEIGQYLGVRIVVTTNVESAASGTSFTSNAPSPHGQTSGSAAVDITNCILMKPKAAVALVWGKEPEIKVFDWPVRDQVRIGLYCAYNVAVVHPDAIVTIGVADY